MNAVVDSWYPVTHSKSIISEDGSLFVLLCHAILSIHYIINKIQCLKETHKQQEMCNVWASSSISPVGELSCRNSASDDSWGF